MSLTTKYSIFLSLLIWVTSIKSFTLMIDPIGDAKHTGREIEDTFERGLTIQCAQKLKDELAVHAPNIRVVLTRVPGEMVQPLQNASFANRLNVDFYLSLSFYQEASIPAHISIFYYLQHLTDLYHAYNQLMLYHAYQAHLINIQVTPKIAQLCFNILRQSTQNSAFVCRGVFGAPCTQLLGVKAPALCIEAGLVHKNDWKYLIDPLIKCIQAIIP